MLDRALTQKANYDEIASSWSVPEKLRQEILGHPRVQTHLASGVSRLRTNDYKAYRNGDDVVEIADFELVTNHYPTYDDPVIVIQESEEGRTSQLVRDILLQELKVSVIESTVKNGMYHNDTKQLFNEFANIADNPFENLFNSTMDDMIAQMRESLDKQTQRIQQQIQQRQKQMRERNY